MPVLGSISNMADVWLRAGARMERMTEKQVAKKTIEKLAIVVVTYKFGMPSGTMKSYCQ